MLKALELYGFKSFADKTRFEFPAGITVVVGPNGSGKSNVVDAIKWVLGEQSAKSLRGQDMADVIFKGSGSGGRKPANVAEATIVFDNSEKRLPIDAPEVHVTRRVYRSGEGEYLINRQPCRLKDIKDMFRGTGVGVDAYSLIEQGKVDRLLQASPRDRRAMFEEAAGISRFKAKKIEAQRRLERVDQNLLRLSDIVEEVENRLRSVRAQASKAKRYREYSERLQELRTHVGLTDWRKLSEKLQELERELQQLDDQRAAQAAHAELLEAQSLETESELGVVADGVRLRDTHIARCREQIVSFESACDQQRTRCHDLEEELVRREHEVHALSVQAGDLRQSRAAAAGEVETAERQKAAVIERVRELELQLAELDVQLKGKRAELETQRAEHVAQLRQAAALSTEDSGYRSQLAGLTETIQRCQSRLAELETLLAANQADWEQARAAEADVERAATDKLKELESAQREVAENRRVQARRQQEIAEMSGVLSGLHERTIMLEDWESRREGVGTGAKEVLALALQAASGSFAEVRGLVADVVQASVEVAPLVDVALADAAQHVVVQGEQLIRQVALGSFRPSARVGFVRLDVPGRAMHSPKLELLPGVIGRADRLVETTAEFTDLVHRLLGETWFVDDLTVGLSLQSGPGKGLRFVTRAGQILDADGTIIAGARHGSAGLVSRRSELRELRQRGIVLERQIAEGQREVARLQDNIDQQDQRVRSLAEAHQKLSVSLTEHHVRTRTLAEQLQQRQNQQATTGAELHVARQQHEDVASRLEAAHARLRTIEGVLNGIEATIQSTESNVADLDARRQQAMQRLSAEQIELAKNEQRCHGLRAQLEQLDRDEQQRRKSLEAARHQWEQSLERRRQSERQILRATSELAALYLHKEREASESRELLRRRDELTTRRAQLNDEMQSLRRSSRKIEDQRHERQLAVNAVGHERQTLLERMREDYNIDLAAQEGPLSGEQLQEREQVEEEIASLRKRIQGIGAVNLDALAELDELESRYSSLAGQFEDLKQAKESLERIIQKINADSRRLFLETLEKIRVNFQTLYRRAFGGGRADIVLEEGADVLEGGVDILATPPGKPSFSNSLLSGGEKALTAVALLLAIFQFRPSPFCVLDEVDAPFDEANIGRFIDVLKDFLSFTKFVIVTHSKKTMTSATTLYGVTMQESGVSKRVSVQFEDVSEDGHIRSEAVDRQTEADAKSSDEEAA